MGSVKSQLICNYIIIICTLHTLFKKAIEIAGFKCILLFASILKFHGVFFCFIYPIFISLLCAVYELANLNSIYALWTFLSIFARTLVFEVSLWERPQQSIFAFYANITLPFRSFIHPFYLCAQSLCFALSSSSSSVQWKRFSLLFLCCIFIYA